MMEFRLVDNRYKIIKPLGEGGMGRVYKAFDLQTQKVVALKEISASTMTEAEIDNFKVEFRSLSRLQHPNLVEVYDFGLDDETPYFTMEFVEGDNLLEVVDQLSFEAIYVIAAQIALALDYIHSHGIIHHDVKTSNIMLQDGDINRVKLMDFGLARERNTQTEIMIRGTVEYMAPEMVKEVPIDQRVDLYSLGVVLYQISTGQLPFFAKSKIEYIKKHIEESPRPPQLLRADIPLGLERLILRLLAKEPNDRYAVASEVIEALSHLTGESIHHETEANMLSYVLSGRFLSREDEFEILNKHRRDLQNHQLSTPIIFIEGKNGVGKKRLMNEFKFECQLNRVNVFHHRCHRDRPIVYQPIADILRQVVHFQFKADREKATGIIEKFGSEFARIEPSLMQQYHISTNINPQTVVERVRLFDALSQFFCEVSAAHPYVIYISDVQWMDTASLECLQYIAHNIQSSGPLICLTYLEELSHEDFLGRINSTLLADNKYERIRLDNFSQNQLERFLISIFGTQNVPREFTRELYRETLGNPQYIIAILKMMIEDGIITRFAGNWQLQAVNFNEIGLPDDIAKIVKRRMNFLTDFDQDVLRQLVVYNAPLSISQLLFLSDLPQADLVESLQRLMYFEFVTQLEEESEYAYVLSNPKTHTLLYDDMDPGIRQALHLKIAQTLEIQYGANVAEHAQELAYHYSQTRHRDKIYYYCFEAGKRTEALYASEAAVDYFKKALANLPAELFFENTEVLRCLGRAYQNAQQFQEALGVYDQLEAAAVAIDLSNDELAEIYLDKSKIYMQLHKPEESLEILQYLNDVLAITNPVIKGRLLESLGNLYLKFNQPDKAKEFCNQSYQILKKTGEKQEIAITLRTMGQLALNENDLEKAEKYYHKTLRIARSANNLLLIIDLYRLLGQVARKREQLSRAFSYWNKCLHISQQIQNMDWVANACNNLGVICFQRCEYARAEEFLTRAFKIIERLNNPLGLVTIYANFGLIHTQTGKYRQAIDYFLESMRLFQHPEHQSIVNAELGDLYTILGDFNQAEKHYTATEAIKSPDKTPDIIPQHKISRARKLIQNKHLEKAQKKIEDAIEHIGTNKNSPWYFKARIELIAVTLELGDYATAWSDIEELTAILPRAKKDIVVMLDFLRGRIEWEWNHSKRRALITLQKAARHAHKINIAEYIWRTNGFLGEIYLSSNDVEQAYHYLSIAYQKLEELKANLDDDQLCAIYLQDPEKKRIERSFRQARHLKVQKDQRYEHLKEKGLIKSGTLRYRYGLLNRLLQVFKEISSTLELQELLNRITDLAVELTNTDRGFIMLMDESGQLHFKVARNADARTITGSAFKLSKTVVNKALNSGEVVNLYMTDDFSELDTNSSILKLRLHSIMCAPLKLKAEIIGVLYVDTQTGARQFSDDDVIIFETLAGQASVMIENARLYEELQRTNQVLRDTIDELNEIDVMKSNFVTNVSHEIRTPLTSMIAYAEMLKSRRDSIPSALQDKFINVIHDESRSLLAIVNNILRMSELERSNMAKNFKEINIHDFLTKVEGLGQTIADTNNLIFSCQFGEDLPNLFGDGDQLLEVIRNIFENAVKFTDAPGKITFTIARTAHKVVQISIQDTGRGIRQEELKKIFLKFYQGGSILTQKPDGTGLGLTIAREIIQQHQGQIWAESEPGKGSTFFISLPYLDDYSLLVNHFLGEKELN